MWKQKSPVTKCYASECCDTGQNDTIGKIELFPLIVLSARVTNWKNDIHKLLQQFWVIKSQQRFQFTLKCVRHEANSGMTIHTLVHSSDTFSCHCNSVNCHLRAILCICFIRNVSNIQQWVLNLGLWLTSNSKSNAFLFLTNLTCAT